MESPTVACPVCTLYLRPGITLEHHLTSHPKQKVIEALCRITQNGLQNVQQKISNQTAAQTTNMTFMAPMNSAVNTNITHINQVPMNQSSFIYQQFMSSSGTQPMNVNPLNVNPMNVSPMNVSPMNVNPMNVRPMNVNPMNVNPMNSQFVAVPSDFNPQMVCSPIIFQQQQQVQIMSAAANIPPYITSHQHDLRPVNVLRNPAICSSPSIKEITDPLSITSIPVPVSISEASVENCNTNDSHRPIKSLIPTAVEKEIVHPLPNTKFSIGKPLRMADIQRLTCASVTDIPTTCTVSTATNSLETLSVNDKIENNDNLMIIASCASEINENERLMNVNNFDREVPTSIPAELDEEENLRKDETLDNNDSNRPDIIIETDGDEVVSVTITNVGGSCLSDTDEQHQEQEGIDDDEELSKACQTTIQSVKQAHDDEPNDISEVIVMANQDVYEDEIQTTDISSSQKNQFDSDSQTQRILLTSDRNLQTVENITILEMSDVDFILPNDFMQNGQTIISKVNDIECLNEANREDRPQVLMSIGEETIQNSKIVIDDKYIVNLPNFGEEKIDDESLSRESLNIRADERMPPRGELSEQESNGASEVGWGSRVYQEGGSGMSTSYDLLARESWEASDCSDSEIPPLQSRIEPSSLEDDVDDPDEIASKSPTFIYSCTTCGEVFRCPKERRVHQAKEHSTASSSIVSKKKIVKIVKKRQVRKKKETTKLNTFLKEEPKCEPTEIETQTNLKIETDPLDLDEKQNILCNTCGELFPTMRDWNIHNKKVHGIKMPNRNLICQKCGVTFLQQEKFADHLRIHPLECNVCGKNFYKIPNLRIHLRRHTGVRPHKCEVCTKAFFSKQKLEEHQNVHTGNAPIKCTMCPLSFKRYSNLIQHRNRHHLNIKKKIKDYICHCGEVYHSKSKLQWHKETHESKPKGCKYCHEKFIHMASLTRHIRRIHNQRYVPDESRVNENVECTICKGIYLKSSLEAHMQTHSGKKRHACPICNKEFTTKWNLKLHKWTHASPTSKPFKCELCQSAYIRQTDYISHMNSHKSLRPYTCNYCGCKFIRKYNCIRHVREHEEGKAFTCGICSKSFHRSYYLKEHMRVHSGIRPYSCNICGKTSTTKSNHNKHMKIHHAREPVMTEG